MLKIVILCKTVMVVFIEQTILQVLVQQEKETLLISSGMASIFLQVKGRLKSISSILEKCQKKGIPFEEFENHIEDIAGIRIICQFTEDIYKVVDIIKNRADMQVKEEKDYIENAKKIGYRSYHMIVQYTVETLRGPKVLHVEIQIRTLAMNFWASIEHSLNYKYKGEFPTEIKERLQNAAEAAFRLDEEMSQIRSEIQEAQAYFSEYKEDPAVLNNSEKERDKS